MFRARFFFLLLVPVFSLTGDPPGVQAQEAGASAVPPLEVVGTYPLQGEVLDSRLLIFFNQPIQVADPDTALSFEPTLPGSVEVGSNFLSFHRDTRVDLPQETFRIRIGEGVQGLSGATLAVEARTFTRATFTLNFALRYNNEDAELLYFGLDFNAPVTGEALQRHVAVKDAAGQSIVPRVMGDGSSAKTQLLAVPKSAALPIQFVFAPALSTSSGGVMLGKVVSHQFPAEHAFQVKEAELVNRPNDNAQVRLSFSMPVLTDTLLDRLHLSHPETGEEYPFYFENTGNLDTVVAVLEQDLQDTTSVALNIDAGAVSSGLAVLAQPYTQTLTVKARPLSANYHYWETEGVGGAILRLQLNRRVPVEDLQKHLSVEPEITNLRIEAQGNAYYALHGDWKSAEFYTLKIAPALARGSGDAGEPLNVALEEVPAISGVGFAYPGKIYFPRRSTAPLDLQARNVKEANITLFQLFPNNIVPSLEAMEGDYSYEVFGEKYAQRVGEKTVSIPEQKDTLVTVPLSLEGMMPPDRKGIFGIAAGPTDNYLDTRIVLWTNIGLLAHWQKNELVVFAHDLFTLAPLPMAKVTVYSSKNQEMGFSNTDERGLAHLRALNTSLGVPRVVVVETDTDYTFLDLSARTDDPTGFTESMPRFDSQAYDAFLYGDRTLYRPGETAHLRWVVRSGAGAPVADVPLQFRVLNPKGNAVRTGPTTLSALGTGGIDLETETIWLTGKYTLELKVPGREIPLNTYTFNLEEFVPQRLRAAVDVASTLWLPGQEQQVAVTAEHLFGAPADNRTAELNLILRKGEFKSAQWPDFRFGNDEAFQTEVEALGEAQTGADGKAAFSYAYKPRPEITFPLAAMVSGQVSELGGRAVRAVEEVRILPSPVMLGIAAAGSAGVVDVSVAAINADETPAALEKVTVTLEREVWHYFVRRYQSYNEPKWDKSFETVETREVTLEAGRATTQFNLPASYGYYRLRVSSEATPQFSTQAFYAYWRTIELVQAVRPSLIKLSLDQPDYAVGDEVELRIESPFDGTAVVVQQGEAIQQSYTAEIKDGLGTLRFIADRSAAPNVWLHATVVHVVEEGRPQVYPYSSFAMINLPVKDPVRELVVSFPELPEEVRPEQEVSVTVQTLNLRDRPVSAEVTLALVDEGIHQILGYDLPDPVTWFQRPRQPDFRRAHYYDRVAYDFDIPGVGGDLLARRLGKTSDVSENWIKPLALWSGVVQTNAEGRAQVSFTLPKFSGQVRLVAVAVSEGATGSTESFLYVRQPYMLQTSLPRFALPGDSLNARAVVYNTTEAEVSARFTWAGRGSLSQGGTQGPVSIAAKGEGNVLGSVTAADAAGQGYLHWKVEILDAAGTVVETLEEDAPIPVLPPAVYQSDFEMVVLQPGENRTFQNTRFRTDQQVDLKLNAGATPLMQLDEALKFLAHYPYGCVEQTTSSVLPLYALRKHALLLQTTLKDAARYEHYIKAGMNRLLTMQTSDGGLSMWPGGSDSYAYGSVYALHFLTLVHRDRELEVPEQAYRSLQEYARRILAGEGTAPNEHYLRAYALYVLALDGDTAALEQIQRFDNTVMPLAARYLLAAALALNTQDPARVTEYLASRPAEPYREKLTSGILNSDIRNTAVMLLARMQMSSQDPAVHEDAQQLLTYLGDRRGYTTQETAFAATALGLYLDTLQEQSANASGLVVGPAGEAQIAAGQPFLGESAEKGAAYNVSNTGQSPLFISFTAAGIPAEGAVEAKQQGVSIARVYRDAAGVPVDSARLAHGATQLIELTITCEQGINNLVVADLLAAGLEIENPRLDADALAIAEEQGAVTPSHLEVRDDRLVLAFDHLPQGTHHFYYLVRAVTPGKFQYPPAYAECMYEPAIHGNSAPGTVEIVEAAAPGAQEP